MTGLPGWAAPNPNDSENSEYPTNLKIGPKMGRGLGCHVGVILIAAAVLIGGCLIVFG